MTGKMTFVQKSGGTRTFATDEERKKAELEDAAEEDFIDELEDEADDEIS